MVELLKEWWPLGFALLTGILGFRTAQERNRWRIDAMEKEVKHIQDDVTELKKDRGADAVTLGIIQVSLDQIKGLLGELRTEIKQKADK